MSAARCLTYQQAYESLNGRYCNTLRRMVEYSHTPPCERTANEQDRPIREDTGAESGAKIT